ncbi:N-carbamoylputrescine amidase [Sphingobium subterraneum]|uniref:N-carbamoylputrescine amidase n=1 Tax=Sphingobium subterraneum TaxID=627688 RepID=A0A841J241_9SPHN|nr:N-carbamoylputrescine amidase [Sphingobium subterraneum]MBB6123606.1 N-carbamoylputrescine amidase [Sphingobium subterraneum]
MTKATVAALQLALTDDIDENIARVSGHIRKAAVRGAKIILPPELFEGHYFCVTEEEEKFARARPLADHPAVLAMQALAAELQVYIPTSFFERDGQHHYNSLAMIDDTGAIMGTYRKSHIPDGPGYEEKYFFRPGNTGFRVWETKYGTIGVGICWDQWYPETARIMALMGAEMLLFPTAIGSEPYDTDLDTSKMWRRAMLGHAVSNCMPVIAANRIGTERASEDSPNEATFYGHSFICDEWGEFVAEVEDWQTGALVATLDLDRARRHRAGMGFFRDRRPDLYGRLVQDI